MCLLHSDSHTRKNSVHGFCMSSSEKQPFWVLGHSTMTNENKTGLARKPVAIIENNATTNHENKTMTTNEKGTLTSDQIAICNLAKAEISEGVLTMLDEFAFAKVRLADLIDKHAIAMDKAGIDAKTIGKVLNEATEGVCEPQHVSARLCKLDIRRRTTKALSEKAKANLAKAEKAVHKHVFSVPDTVETKAKPVTAEDIIGKYEQAEGNVQEIVRAYFAAM